MPTAERFPSSGSGGSATSSNFTFEMSPTSPDKYLEGHCIDGRVLFPATGYLVLAWKTLAKFVGLLPEHLPVAFEDVTIHRATILPKTGAVTLTVHYMPSSNKFDVSEGETLAVSGKVSFCSHLLVFVLVSMTLFSFILKGINEKGFERPQHWDHCPTQGAQVCWFMSPL